MKNVPVLALLIILLFSACNQPEPSPYPDIVFNKVSSHPVSGRSTAVSFVIKDTAYVALGRNSLFKGALKDCWAYYPETDNWTQKSDFPGIARVNAIAEVIDNKAYVGLGFYPDEGVYVNNYYLRDFWMYDAETNTWEQKADFPGTIENSASFTSGCVSFVANNQLYLGAGFNGYSFSNEFWKYDPLSNQWTQLNDFNGKSRAIATAVTCSNRVFFGTGYHTYNLNDWWEYFPASDSWSKREQMPDKGRVNALSFTINNRIFVGTGRHFGGTQTNGEIKSDIFEYDFNKDVWYKRGNLNQARENAICFTVKGKVYIGFGENDTEVFNDLWSFEP
jgi:N-acetylneuraminic acid mutarotase